MAFLTFFRSILGEGIDKDKGSKEVDNIPVKGDLPRSPRPRPVVGKQSVGYATSGTPESRRTLMATEALASNELAHAAESHPALSVKNVEGTMQPVAENAPAPGLSLNGVPSNMSIASVHAAEYSASEQITDSPPSAPHEATDTTRPSGLTPSGSNLERHSVEVSTSPQLIVPNTIFPNDDGTLGAMIRTSSQSSSSEESCPAPDKIMTDLPQELMPPSTSHDMTAPNDEQPDAESSSSQQPTLPPTSPDMTIPKTRQQLILQDGPNKKLEADEQFGVVNPTILPVKTSKTSPISTDSAPAHLPEHPSDCRNAADTLKVHISGLSEPDVDSLLELIQEEDGFGEESKPQRDKLAETIRAVRDASQSKEWSNLLRGVIILATCLEFPKGDVSKTRT